MVQLISSDVGFFFRFDLKTIPFLVPLIFLSQNERCSLFPLLGSVNDTFKVLPSYFLTLLHKYAGSKAVSIHVLQRQGSSLSLNRKKRKDNKILFCFVTVKLLYHGIMRGWICMGIYFNRVEFESGYRVGGSSRFTAYVPFYARQMYKLASKTAQNDIT